MHITDLEANILSPTGAPWKLTLGRLTLLTGHNGVGKSMVSHALRLAVAEHTADVNGKVEVRDAVALYDMLSPVDEGPLFAHATFDEGAVAAWGTTREGDTTKSPEVEHPTGVDPARVLPLATVEALFAGDASAARQQVLTWIGADVTLDEVLVHVPAHLHEMYRTAAAAQTGSTVDRLSAVGAYAVQRMRDLETEAKAQDALVDQLDQSLPALPTDAQCDEADAAVLAWDRVRTAAIAYEAAVAAQGAIGNVAERAAGLRVELDRAAAATAYWAERGTPPADAARVEHARALLVGHDDRCPLCGLTNGVEALNQWAAYYDAQAAALEAEGAAAVEAQRHADGWRAEHQRLSAELTAQSMLLAAAQELPPAPGVTSAEATAALDGWRAVQAERINTREKWGVLIKARNIAAERRSQRHQYEELSVACKGAVTSILDASKARFEAAVQRFLPEGWAFQLILERTLPSGEVRLTCQPAIAVDGGPLRPYQSGTRRSAVMAAIAMALAELGGAVNTKKKGAKKTLNAAKYFLIIPPDRDRDTETLGDLMRAWANFPGQVIVESTERPRGKLPAGWTHLDMDEIIAGWKSAAPQARSCEDSSPSEAPAPPPPVEVVPPPAAEVPLSARPGLPDAPLGAVMAREVLKTAFGWSAEKLGRVPDALLEVLAERKVFSARALVVPGNPVSVTIHNERGQPIDTLRA